MSDDRELELRARQAYRSAPPLDAEARDRLLEAVRSAPLPRRHWFPLAFPGERPIRTVAALAGAVTVVLLFMSVTALDRTTRSPRIHRAGDRGRGATTTAAGGSNPGAASSVGVETLAADPQLVSFQVQAAGAERVALVGDFNGWNAQAAPMEPTGRPGTWAVTVAVPRGRHLYAFLVNGRQWLADPVAPLAPEDGYGVPNSVVIVGGLTAS